MEQQATMKEKSEPWLEEMKRTAIEHNNKILYNAICNYERTGDIKFLFDTIEDLSMLQQKLIRDVTKKEQEKE